MIEASNSIIANATVLRGAAEQVSSGGSLQSAPVPVQEVTQVAPDAPRAPYISPYIYIDLNYNKAVLQIRDSDTGDVVQQFPTESRLAEQSRVSARAETSRQPLPRENVLSSSQSEEVSVDLSVGTAAVASAPRSEYQAPRDIITVQEVSTAAPVRSGSASPPVAAVAFFSAGDAAASASKTGGGVSVFA